MQTAERCPRCRLGGGAALFTQIVDKMTVDLDLSIFHDSYKERIEEFIESKMKEEIAQVEEKKQRNRWPRA
jgi:non-homologous end joining protein Ku